MEALLLGSRVITFNFVPSRIQRIKLIKGTYRSNFKNALHSEKSDQNIQFK